MAHMPAKYNVRVFFDVAAETPDWRYEISGDDDYFEFETGLCSELGVPEAILPEYVGDDELRAAVVAIAARECNQTVAPEEVEVTLHRRIAEFTA